MDLKNKTCVVKFWAEWCQPCHAVAPKIKLITQKMDVELVEVDVDAEQNHELASEFGVRSIPMVVALKDGQPVGQLVGVQTDAKYEELFAKLK